MITYELLETRDVPGDGRRDLPCRAAGPAARRARGAGRTRPGTAARRARPAPGRLRRSARPAASCPAPVALAPRAVVSRARYRVRRLVAGAGLALASAAVVFGLGLLSDVAAAGHAAATGPVAVLDGS